MLEMYLLSGSVERIKKELDEIEAKRQILLERLKKLEEKGYLRSREEEMKYRALRELQEKYVQRRKQNIHRDFDYAWITSPRNLQRVKILGKTPEEILEELEEWYSQDKEAKRE